ncbi:MAG: tyrosine--tRNA ligase [Anaerolineae bacterium]|nr:tyrosine--tRNA ligase [Anaerolineae bacterium]
MAILMRGIDYGDDQILEVMTAELCERLGEGRPLRVYCGYDPTAPDLHLGHTVTMVKLRQFQDLGHEVTFVIGTFTGVIGDPSDRDTPRPQQTAEEAAAKAANYAAQAYRILDPQRTTVRYNAEWLAGLTLADVVELASCFTLQQILAQDRLARRQRRGDPIWVHEALYPLLQGYDAVALEADVQVGGTEQLFNLLAGRRLQEHYGQRPQVVLTLPILVGTDGHARMSKSAGNVIGIDEPPNDMYGKVMRLPDHAMVNYYTLVTRFEADQVAAVERGLADGSLDPMQAKMRLAREIVSRYHGQEAAARAERHFRRVHRERKPPAEMPVYRTPHAEMPLIELLVDAGLAPTKSQARRLVTQGGVRVDGDPVEDVAASVPIRDGTVVQVGRRGYVRLARAEGRTGAELEQP